MTGYAYAEDVIAWAEAGGGAAEFVLLAVTPEQVEEPKRPVPGRYAPSQAAENQLF